MRIRVKICCIGSPEEAALAVGVGADALGLVGPMPSGPGVIPLERAAAIAGRVPPPVVPVLLTRATDFAEIAEEIRLVAPLAVQLVDATPAAERARLKREFRALRILQVVHVRGPRSVEEARAAAEASDALLLDSGRPDAATPELGGTGRTHDWTTSRRIVEEAPVPVFLAGGLRPENVAEAIAAVRPWGVDVCTGVRENGQLAPARLRAFVAAVRAAEEGGR